MNQQPKVLLLPPSNEVCEGYVFTGVCLSTGRGGVHGCRGHAWLWGVMCGCGGCMVVGGYVWLWGACVFAGRCAWLQGGVCGCRGGMCGCRGACVGYDEIRSMSGRYASYWNAFLLRLSLVYF